MVAEEALAVVVPAEAGKKSPGTQKNMSVKSHSLFLFLLLLAAGENAIAQQSLRILFAGDVMGHDSQINAAFIDSSDSYDYRSCFFLPQTLPGAG